MQPFRRFACLGVMVLACLAAGFTHAQNLPHVAYAYPAGGRQGSTFLVTLGGQFLDGATNLHVSGPGVRAQVLQHIKPLTQKQINDLREKPKELQEKRATALAGARQNERAESGAATNRSAQIQWTAADDKRIAEIREKLAAAPKRQANPSLGETVALKVTIDTNAAPGTRELRLEAAGRLSNPLNFQVGQLPEFREPDQKTGRPEVVPGITTPVVVNGQIMPGDVDRFRFQARQGEHLLVAASARELIPYLPDAVPGWFQATVALRDAQGKEVAYQDDFRFKPDPVIQFEVPRDGEYVVEIKDAIYRGREDFVYRLTIGKLPFLSTVFPLGGPAGKETAFALEGINLPATRLVLDNDKAAPGIRHLTVTNAGRSSNPLPVAVSALPECLEQEPNHEREKSQALTIPVIVNGRIDAAGDIDVFRFTGEAGSEWVAEVCARHLDSPLDSRLQLIDAAGKELMTNDDCEDKGAGLTTHHADSYLRFKLPAAGTYFLKLTDAQQNGGADYAYRLRLSPPQPDFELRVVPSTINARMGTPVPVTVYALRKDGFANEIAIVLQNAPAGITLHGGRIPPNQDEVRMTLTVTDLPTSDPVTLQLLGRARIKGRETIHEAVPAEDMMQAFSYRHLVPAQELKLAVIGRGVRRAPLRVAGEMPVKIPAGGTAKIQLPGPKRANAGALWDYELDQPPEGLSIRDVVDTARGTDIILASDPAKIKPGLEGNLIIHGYLGDRNKVSGKGGNNRRRTAVGTLPAVPFEVVP